MMPMTNAEIQARKTPAMVAAERGLKIEVSQSKKLRKAHEMVWSADDAEIRDNASGDKIVFRGIYADCVAEAKRVGLWA